MPLMFLNKWLFCWIQTTHFAIIRNREQWQCLLCLRLVHIWDGKDMLSQKNGKGFSLLILYLSSCYSVSLNINSPLLPWTLLCYYSCLPMLILFQKMEWTTLRLAVITSTEGKWGTKTTFSCKQILMNSYRRLKTYLSVNYSNSPLALEWCKSIM